jgi:hypothetical protein
MSDEDMIAVDEIDDIHIFFLYSLVSAMNPSRRGSEACSWLVPPEQQSANLAMAIFVD